MDMELDGTGPLIPAGGGGGGGHHRHRGSCCSCCSCCCGRGGGGGPAGRLLWEDAPSSRQRELRLLRRAQILVATLLLVTAAALALLLTVGLRGTGSQEETQSGSSPAGVDFTASKLEYQRADQRPVAILRAPRNKTKEKYLNWESNFINTYQLGGFNSSSTDLVVPRRGLYRVFLQLTWDCRNHNERLVVSSNVLTFSEDYPRDVAILKMHESLACPEIKSLYASSLFCLEPRSRLRVAANHRQYITQDEKQVFFGAELIEPLRTCRSGP